VLEYPIYSGEPFRPNIDADGCLGYQFIIGIDPAPDGFYSVAYDWANERIIHVDKDDIYEPTWARSLVVVEKIMSYGMAVSTSIFKTVFNTGFLEAEWSGRTRVYGPWIAYVSRKEVKMHFCNSLRAKDGNIRAALIDRFGEPGTKKSPGVLYGIKKDWWAALAVAVYAADWLAEQQSNRIGG